MRHFIIIILTLLSSAAMGQVSFKLASFALSIKGTSNLHAWESKVTDVRSAATIQADLMHISAIQAMTVEIPVRSIKSDNGSIMDNKTYDALKANSFPNITMKLVSVNKIEKKTDADYLSTTCNLTVGGVTNKIDMLVKGRVASDGTVKFSGSKKIKMSDYKIKAPTALLGTLTTGDEVEIVFSVTLKKA